VLLKEVVVGVLCLHQHDGHLHCPFTIHRQSALLLLVWRPDVISRVAFSASSYDGGSYNTQIQLLPARIKKTERDFA
jgi:hypothetical protein